MRKTPITSIEQLCSRSRKEPNGCWLWAGPENNKGYGLVYDGDKLKSVHRLAYSLTHPDENIEGLVIRHKCDTRLCCNPDHLEIGTCAENSRDMVERGRSVQGEKHHKAKLSEDGAVAIKYLLPMFSHLELAEIFGVSYVTIHQIRTGLKWKHI